MPQKIIEEQSKLRWFAFCYTIMNICKIGFSRILLFFRNVLDMSIDLDIYFIYML